MRCIVPNEKDATGLSWHRKKPIPVVGAVIVVISPLLLGLVSSVQLSTLTVLYAFFVFVAMVTWINPRLFKRNSQCRSTHCVYRRLWYHRNHHSSTLIRTMPDSVETVVQPSSGFLREYTLNDWHMSGMFAAQVIITDLLTSSSVIHVIEKGILLSRQSSC